MKSQLMLSEEKVEVQKLVAAAFEILVWQKLSVRFSSSISVI
jgi:hypothetical protein